MAPSTQQQWNVQGKQGFDSLVFNEEASVPEPGAKDVLVKLHGASLNYRDLIIPKGMYPFAQRDGVVPASDGAGVVEAVGDQVHRFKPGDKVVTLFNQAHIAGSLDGYSVTTGVGGTIDGCLRQYGVFSEEGLVHMPSNMDYLEASTLTCAGLTAWNALYGLKSCALKPGDVVLTQGTGGVSIFALQFAKAAGATVIATTSSQEKAETLKKLGADHVLNYKENAEWGKTAKELTGGRGCQHIVEVGGPTTMKQSLAAVAIDGVISIIGFLGGARPGEKPPSFLDCLNNICTVRGVLVGSRLQMEDMVKACEANDLHPVVDKKKFSLKETRDAYEYMWAQKHFGKLCITVQ